MVERLAPKLLSWASILDEQTRAQAETTSGMPFIHPHLALMPDAHLGKGATVGSVIPTLGAIIPAAVGVDIGCGMVAVRTQLAAADLRRTTVADCASRSSGRCRSRPAATTGELTATAAVRIAELERRAEEAGFDPSAYAPNWRLQLGTLGSGNHFIEVTADETGTVWLFLHSGSRGIGNKIAVRHIAVAAQLCAQWWIPLPDRDLAYLVEGTPEFDRYLAELTWAQHFALLNREEMMDRRARLRPALARR